MIRQNFDLTEIAIRQSPVAVILPCLFGQIIRFLRFCFAKPLVRSLPELRLRQNFELVEIAISIFIQKKNIRTQYKRAEYDNHKKEWIDMDDRLGMILQMLQMTQQAEGSAYLAAFQEAAQLQQLIMQHAAAAQQEGRPDWQISMLTAIRPRLPEANRRMVDIMIKCLELKMLLES